MKKFIALLFLSFPFCASFGAELQLTNAVKASLIFREETNAPPGYPHVLLVYLRLENRHDSEVTWACDSVVDVEAELFDAHERPVSRPPGPADILSNTRAYMLPYHSILEWMLCHGGISMRGNLANSYVLEIGGKGWLIPVKSVSTYSLKIRVKGVPWSQDASTGIPHKTVLFEALAKSIRVSK